MKNSSLAELSVNIVTSQGADFSVILNNKGPFNDQL